MQFKVSEVVLEEQITRLSFSMCSNKEHLVVMENLLKVFSKHKTPVYIVPTIGKLSDAFDIEKKTYRAQKAFVQTSEIDHYDEQWRAAYRILKSKAKNLCVDSDRDVAQAAKTLDGYISGGLIKLAANRNERLGGCIKLLDDFEGKYAAQVKLIGAEQEIVKMRAAADKESDLIMERGDERDAMGVGRNAMLAVRANCDHIFEKIARMLNGDAEKETDDAALCRNIISTVNSVIKELNVFAPNRKKKSSEADADEKNGETAANGKHGKNSKTGKTGKQHDKHDDAPDHEKTDLKPEGGEGEGGEKEPTPAPTESPAPTGKDENPAPSDKTDEAPEEGENENLKPAQ